MTNPKEVRLKKTKVGQKEEIISLPPAKELSGKTVYLEIDDEVTTIYDRIKRLKSPKLFIFIPRRAIILQSLINLRILKRKAKDIGKTLVLITNDAIGIKIAKQVGFDVLETFPHLKEDTGKKEPVSLTPTLQNLLSRPTRIAERKLALTQLIRRGGSQKWQIISTVKEFFRKRKKNKKRTEIIMVTPSKQALITLIIVSTAVLLIIAYIALPGATIILTPAETRIDQPVNITLSDYEKNRAELERNLPLTLASYRITPPPVRRAIVQAATGKIFQGENSRGTATLYNLSNHAWPLVATTRLQTDNGIIFRIQRDVTVPPAVSGKAGTLDVTIVADEFDVNGQTVGERGNIGASRFFLPGLKNSENRKNLYAENKNPITGGITAVSKMITKEDVEAAQERAKKEIKLLAEDALKNYLFSQNRDRGTSLELLTDSRTITVSEPKLEIPPNLAGKAMEQFEITAEVKVSGVAFVKKELISTMKSEMELRQSPGKTIVSIVEDSLSYKIFEIDANSGKIKLTATIRGREQYDIDPQSDAGAKLIKRLQDHIIGKKKDEAVSFIQNLPEVDRVTIKSWPFWAPTLPTVTENIKFVVENEETAVSDKPTDALEPDS